MNKYKIVLIKKILKEFVTDSFIYGLAVVKNLVLTSQNNFALFDHTLL